MKTTYRWKKILSLALGTVSAVSVLSGCGAPAVSDVKAQNLMTGVQRAGNAAAYDFKEAVETPEGYEKYTDSFLNFSVKLFANEQKEGQNVLLSPLSTFFALGMAANGAQGDTLQEFKKQLGGGVVSVDNIGACSNYLMQRLTAFNSEDGKTLIADSLWLNKELEVTRSFLQKNANNYNADVYAADFSSADTVQDMNTWVGEKTNGKIDSIIKDADPSTVMYLINALALDDAWATPYNEGNIEPGTFTKADGTKSDVSFMSSTERFLHSDDATGFVKNLKTLPCRFVAVLPNETITLDEYVKTLDGTKLSELLSSGTGTDFAAVQLPMFTSEYSVNLKDSLIKMGLKTAFSDSADFGKIAPGNLFLGNVMHKTYIDVGPLGVKAGAATAVEVNVSAAVSEHKVLLDRPFLYLIVDNESNLPLFMGTVTNPQANDVNK